MLAGALLPLTLCLTGGQVLLPDHSVERADVLVDPNAGEILAVGPALDGDQTLDTSGGLVIPGLVNAHTHAAMTLLRGYADDKPVGAWLEEDVWPVEAELEPPDIRAGADLGILEMIRSGTTTFADMYFGVEQTAAAVEASGVRALLGRGTVTLGKSDEAVTNDVNRSLEVAAEFAGAADGRVSTAAMPHALSTIDEDSLRELVERARERGFRLHYHANENEQVDVTPLVAENGTRPLVYADELGALEPGDFLAHCVHVDDEEIDLLADRDVAVVHCPASSMKLASGLAPVQRMLDAGVTVALGTDGAASNNDLDVFGEMRDAAMVGKLAAKDASAVPAEAVLQMATRNGARALGINAGRIEPGAKADLAVVNLEQPHLTPVHDLVSHLVYAANGADVRHTVCDGAVLMRDREVLTMDEQAVRETATERAAALVARAA
ncbi:amidohydrolase [Halolamina sp.]|uniref:amidohydrolase n=1 Tax=Halolamina sp. TaxID=1940283 RepID=UPI0035624C5B